MIWCRSSATAAAAAPFSHLLTRTGTFLLLPERLHHRAFHPSSHTPNLSKFAFRISTLSSIFNLTHASSPNPQDHLRSKRPRIAPVRSKATSFHSHRFTTNLHVIYTCSPPSPIQQHLIVSSPQPPQTLWSTPRTLERVCPTSAKYGLYAPPLTPLLRRSLLLPEGPLPAFPPGIGLSRVVREVKPPS